MKPETQSGLTLKVQMATKVLNKYRDVIPKGSVYVGRPTIWGNPYSIGKDGTREEVIAKHKASLLLDPVKLGLIKEKLAGKNLVCFCAPLPCHADILLEIANEL